MCGYVGRFAPSPTGPLHDGSLVAALASWLDARAHGGRWLVRIEDVDGPRCVPGAAGEIVRQLEACGLVADEVPIRQHDRGAHYRAAMHRLAAAGRVYRCVCTRREIERVQAARGLPHQRHGERVYPGTCRPVEPAPVRFDDVGEPAAPIPDGDRGTRGPGAWRLRVSAGVIGFEDRRCGPQQQDVMREVGDFVLRRADGCWAYQLAVVVDDAAQGVTHVVRGEDLLDNTARQIALQQALALPTPRYLHTPLVLGADGEKLSKQHGATPIDARDPVAALRRAAVALQLELPEGGPSSPAPWLAQATVAWARRWAIG